MSSSEPVQRPLPAPLTSGDRWGQGVVDETGRVVNSRPKKVAREETRGGAAEVAHRLTQRLTEPLVGDLVAADGPSGSRIRPVVVRRRGGREQRVIPLERNSPDSSRYIDPGLGVIVQLPDTAHEVVDRG